MRFCAVVGFYFISQSLIPGASAGAYVHHAERPHIHAKEQYNIFRQVIDGVLTAEYLNSLTMLDMSGQNLTTQYFLQAVLPVLQRTPQVRSINLSNNPGLDIRVVAGYLAPLTTLTSIKPAILMREVLALRQPVMPPVVRYASPPIIIEKGKTHDGSYEKRVRHHPAEHVTRHKARKEHREGR